MGDPAVDLPADGPTAAGPPGREPSFPTALEVTAKDGTDAPSDSPKHIRFGALQLDQSFSYHGVLSAAVQLIRVYLNKLA